MSLNLQLDSHKIYSGWLSKKGAYFTSFKKRYFVLYDDRTISYFSNEKNAKHRTKCNGSIHLSQIKRVELVQCILDNNSTSTIRVNPAISVNSSRPISIKNLKKHFSFDPKKLQIETDVKTPENRYRPSSARVHRCIFPASSDSMFSHPYFDNANDSTSENMSHGPLASHQLSSKENDIQRYICIVHFSIVFK